MVLCDGEWINRNEAGGCVVSMDFTGVKAITIPEGAVKKITNQAGHVLWEKPSVSEDVKVTIKGYGDPDYCYVKLGGVMYTDPATISVPSGTTLEAYSTGVYRGTITLDGTHVSSGKPATHTMAVDSALTVNLVFDSTLFSGIEITH